MFSYTNDLCEAYRSVIKAAARAMQTSLGGVERLQNCQMNATREILSAHAKAAAELDDAATIHELAEIGTRLGWFQFDKFLACWSGLHSNLGRNQMELIKQAQTQSLEIVEEAGRVLDGVPLAPGAEQMVTALRLVIDTTRSSYAAGMRAIAEAEREAVARLEAEPTPASAPKSEKPGRRGGEVRAAA